MPCRYFHKNVKFDLDTADKFSLFCKRKSQQSPIFAKVSAIFPLALYSFEIYFDENTNLSFRNFFCENARMNIFLATLIAAIVCMRGD
jgi:hypothetical protein